MTAALRAERKRGSAQHQETVRIPEGRVWLRVAAPAWEDPFDPSFARNQGGRWNPPGSYPVLYLSGDIRTARAQVERMLAGSPVHIDDLGDDAYVLVVATLPQRQTCADAVSVDGLRALGLPDTYPLDSTGALIGHSVCQAIGKRVRTRGLRGVWCRSAATTDGRGRELAWFPATSRSTARKAWENALPLGAWRYAATWNDLGMDSQPDLT